MTDIQGLRAQLRDTRPATRSSSSGGGGGIPFWAIAAGAAALGFAIVLFTPRFYTTQRTAALPDVQTRAEPAESAPPATAQRPAAPHAAVPQAAAPEAPASRYAGKAPEEVVRTVEIVCDERARALRWCCVRRRPAQGGGREAALLPDRGAGALLRAQSEAQGDRRRHQLLQGHRIHQHGDHRRRQARRGRADGRRARRRDDRSARGRGDRGR